MAFGSMVISEKLPLEKCPYLSPEVVAAYKAELQEHYAACKWTKRDMTQVLILNHMAQGGSAEPTGNWKGLVGFPNTVSKIKMNNMLKSASL